MTEKVKEVKTTDVDKVTAAKLDGAKKLMAVKRAMQVCLVDPTQRQAIVYLAPKVRVKVTRFGKARKGSADSFRVEIGKPNYQERGFVKTCQKAGQPFPLKKVQVMSQRVKRQPKTKK